MKSQKRCAICESPSARSIHFGARSCKACAAFFRRTVALRVTFECKERIPCTIHYEKRMSCKKCRFDKCIAVNMDPRLVRSSHGSHDTTHSLNDSDITVEDNSNVTRLDFDDFRQSTSEQMNSAQVHRDTTPRLPVVTECDRYVAKHYIRIEAALNSRRKILYTDAKMADVFSSICKCPYERRHLKPLNYKDYVGMSRADIIMLYDYAESFLDFDRLDASQKPVLYRYICGVDSLMSSAYFTSCLGFDESLMVLSTCDYICVDPMPMTGDEPWAQHLFSTKEDLMKYKSIVPWKASLWSKLVVPFHRLNIEFEEFCILKALTCWHVAHYKLNEDGRRICEKQRDLLIGSLFDVCSESSSDPAERVGSLMLFISCVFLQMLEMVDSLVMITFFDIVDYDPVFKDFFKNDSY
ncbi:hypothetical protein Q1695_006475 [Nippostrongylus brasiliensis]|nr:hypothetical protein Q1695_006475 [Nippostrongylus brasiliensis]